MIVLSVKVDIFKIKCLKVTSTMLVDYRREPISFFCSCMLNWINEDCKSTYHCEILSNLDIVSKLKLEVNVIECVIQVISCKDTL